MSGATNKLIPSALEKDRWVPLRLERLWLTPAGAFVSDESEAKAHGITRPSPNCQMPVPSYKRVGCDAPEARKPNLIRRTREASPETWKRSFTRSIKGA